MNRDWLIQTSIGTCVPASPCGHKAPSPSAPNAHRSPQTTTALFRLFRQLLNSSSGSSFPEVWGKGPQCSSPRQSPTSPFTPSPSPGGLSQLPDEALPTLISPACAPGALWLAPFSMARGTTSSSQPPAAGRRCFSYLLSKIVGSSGLGRL